MRYELEIIAYAPLFPTPEELAEAIQRRGVFAPQILTRVGFEKAEDAPRMLLEEASGARVLVGYERSEYAAELVAGLREAPPSLRARLGPAEENTLGAANAAFRISLNRPGGDPANAVRFVVHVADALVELRGGIVLDEQLQLVWGAERWRAEGANGDLDLRRHLVLHAEELEGGLWVHTHGLLRFDRPDLEVLGVAAADLDAAAQLLSEVARFLASGGGIATGETLELGGTRLRFEAGGTQVPNDFDGNCLRLLDAADALRARSTRP